MTFRRNSSVDLAVANERTLALAHESKQLAHFLLRLGIQSRKSNVAGESKADQQYRPSEISNAMHGVFSLVRARPYWVMPALTVVHHDQLSNRPRSE